MFLLCAAVYLSSQHPSLGLVAVVCFHPPWDNSESVEERWDIQWQWVQQTTSCPDLGRGGVDGANSCLCACKSDKLGCTEQAPSTEQDLEPQHVKAS